MKKEIGINERDALGNSFKLMGCIGNGINIAGKVYLQMVEKTHDEIERRDKAGKLTKEQRLRADFNIGKKMGYVEGLVDAASFVFDMMSEFALKSGKASVDNFKMDFYQRQLSQEEFDKAVNKYIRKHFNIKAFDNDKDANEFIKNNSNENTIVSILDEREK